MLSLPQLGALAWGRRCVATRIALALVLALALTPTADARRRDNRPPTAHMTAPADGATVSGTVTVSATASDNRGVDHVTFRLDGVAIASDYSAPYAFQGDSTKVCDGSDVLSVR